MSAQPRNRATGHWSNLEERGEFLGLKSMLMVYRVLGRTGFALLLYPVMAYFFLAGGTARRASIDYLSRVYADDRGRQVLRQRPGWSQSFRHFLCFGEAVLDKLLAWTGKIRLEDVDFENHELFDRLQASGRGAVLIASHLGNSEVCRALGMRAKRLKINVLVHTKHAENFNRLMQSESSESTVSLIQTTEVGPDTAMLLRQKVDDGEFVVIVGDRTPVGHAPRASWASFLGRPAPFPQGPFILAALLKCPVLLLFCVKRGRRFRILFEPFCDQVEMPRRRRAEVLDALIARYAERLEFHCLNDPYQWFNLFDFWTQASRAQPGDANTMPLEAGDEIQSR